MEAGLLICVGLKISLFAVKEQPVRDLREAPRTSHNETHKSGFRLETLVALETLTAPQFDPVVSERQVFIK